MEKNNHIIADSSAIISLLIPTDSNNAQALLISTKLRKQSRFFSISTDVFSECINTLGKKFGHNSAEQIAENILNTKQFQLMNTSHDTLLHALEKFKTLPNSVSYTDCVVMATADQLKTKTIFGFDEVFQKEGYTLP